MLLKSLDLFAGVGGMTLAFRGLCIPQLYCDVCPRSRAVLQDAMQSGRLPEAPVYSDVRQLVDTEVPKADIVLGGFPCQGFSLAGYRRGFQHEQSALFFECLRLLDASGATAVFFENVPQVWSKGREAIVRELAVDRGFELFFCVIPACNVGSPMQRSRWFCLGMKRDCPLRDGEWGVQREYVPYDWSQEPARTAVDPGNRVARLALLGNALVPDCARMAFFRLLSGGEINSFKDQEIQFRPGPDREHVHRRGNRDLGWVAAGQDGVVYHNPLVPLKRFDFPVLRLDPACWQTPEGKRPSPRSRHATITDRVLLTPLWFTPRKSNTSASHRLTKRSYKDLPTQVRFEQGTTDRSLPLNPAFVEHLMGLPLQHTAKA